MEDGAGLHNPHLLRDLAKHLHLEVSPVVTVGPKPARELLKKFSHCGGGALVRNHIHLEPRLEIPIAMSLQQFPASVWGKGPRISTPHAL